MKNITIIAIIFSIILFSGCLDAIEESERRTSREVVGDKPTQSPSTTLTPFPMPTARPMLLSNDLQKASSDYQWRFDLVKEQTNRIDMVYAMWAGVQTNCVEYSSWLSQLKIYTDEFIIRNLEAIRSGNNYARVLHLNVNNIDIQKGNYEIDRINVNTQVMYSDIQKAINSYNENALQRKNIC